MGVVVIIGSTPVNFYHQDRILNFEVFDKDTLLAKVSVDFDSQQVSLQQFSNNPVDRPFLYDSATVEDVLNFLEFRCFPRTRFNCQELLSDLGLTHYNPLEIVRRTHGLQLEDFVWVKFEGEDLTYDTIKLRD